LNEKEFFALLDKVLGDMKRLEPERDYKFLLTFWRRFTNRALHSLRKRCGICVRCGKNKPDIGTMQCKPCKVQNALYKRKRYNNAKKYHSDWRDRKKWMVEYL